MKIQNCEEKVEIPKNVEVQIDRGLIKIKGSKGNLERRFLDPSITIEKKDNFVVFSTKKMTRKEKRIMNTFIAHLNNMFKGVTGGFQYKLKVCSGHFPISVIIKGNVVEISNFLGEKIPRRTYVLDGVTVKIDGDIVLVDSIDLEKAGTTAARIEQATRITNRDRRVFQDGIYIIQKPGVTYE